MAKHRSNGQQSRHASNGHAKEPARAPAGGTRVGGKFYRGGSLMPARYNRERDPATGVPLAAPNFGRMVLPHATTFVGKQSTIAHVYRNPDEAVLRSGGQAWKMRRDPSIMECLEARQRATALLGWHLEVEDEKDPQQKKLKEVMTKVIKRTYQFTEYRRNLLEALWYGRYAVQHKFGFQMIDGERRTIIEGWRPINGDKLVFRFDDGSGRFRDDEVGIRVTPIYSQRDKIAGDRKLEVTDVGMAYFLEPWERSLVAIHRHIIEDGDYEDPISAGRIHGVGIRDRIYWCWYQKQETMAQLMEVIDRTGSGITIYWYPAGNPQAEADTIALAEKQKHENVLVMPRQSGDPTTDAYGIERVEPNASGIDIMRGIVDELFGNQIMRYINGGTLYSKSESLGIGGGGADFQERSFHQIVDYDAVKLEETISHEMVTPLKTFNCPWAHDIPLFFRIDTDSVDAEEKLSAAEKLWQMGAKIKTAELMSKVGLSMPTEEDEFLQNPAAVPQQGAPGQPGIPQDGQSMDGQQASIQDLFGDLAGSGADPGQEGGGEQGGPEGGEPPTQPPSGPIKYAKRQVKSSPGQKPLPSLGDDNAKQHHIWREELHPRKTHGQFAEKPGAKALPHQHGQGMLFTEMASKLHQAENHSDPKAGKAQQKELYDFLAASDIPKEQLSALMSGDPGSMMQLKQEALESGRHDPEPNHEAETPSSPIPEQSTPSAGTPGGLPPEDDGDGFELQQQKEKLGRGIGTEDKSPEISKGRQEAFFHGLNDAPGQEKLFQGLDLAGPAEEHSQTPESGGGAANAEDETPSPTAMAHPDEIPYETALNAHRGTSFVPETRAKQRQKDYADTINGDYEELSKLAKTDEERKTLADEFARYKDGYRRHYLEYLHANSRVMSSMITGPAKFPVASNNKKADTAHRRLNELLDFRKRALAAISRKIRPEQSAIKSSDKNAVDSLQKKLKAHEDLHARMKTVNAAHKKFLKDPASLDKLDLPDEDKALIRNYKPAYSWEPHPFPPYRLTNNNATIKQVKDRIASVSKMQSSAPKEESHGGVKMVENPEAGRVQLVFPGKPDEKTRAALKSAGFRWAPSEGAWQRHLNESGRSAARRVLESLNPQE